MAFDGCNNDCRTFIILGGFKWLKFNKNNETYMQIG